MVDLSQCDIWQQEASALDNSAEYTVEDVNKMGWPILEIAALTMAVAKADERNRLSALQEANEGHYVGVLETELLNPEVQHAKI